MTEHLPEAQQPPSVDTANSSRASRSAACSVDCVAAASFQDLYRKGYTPRSLRWTSPKPLWSSVRLARTLALGIPRTTSGAAGCGDADEGEPRPGPDRAHVGRRQDAVVRWAVLGDPGEGDDSQYHVLRPLYATAEDGVHLHRQRRHLPGRRCQRSTTRRSSFAPTAASRSIYVIPGTTTGRRWAARLDYALLRGRPQQAAQEERRPFFGASSGKRSGAEPNPMEQTPQRVGRSGRSAPTRWSGFASRPARSCSWGSTRHSAGLLDGEQERARCICSTRSRRSC